MSQRKLVLFFLSCFVLFFSAVISFADQYNYASLLEVLKFRNIGPAIMGGRTVDFAVVENNTSIIYAAVGPSGVWKSENNGITWSPVFDREGSVSVGTVAVSQSHPDIVWVGALGHEWGPNEERGLFRTIDGGKTWEKVLYVDENTGTEIHCTIYTISESPLKEGVIWIGTDDGLVQLTTDGGKTWTDVSRNIKGFLPESWVTRVEASHFDEGTAYATFDRHRVDDYKPYVYKTTNFGETWMSLSADLPSVGYLHVVREDLENKNLLYVGSEFGLFLSFDGGEKWMAYKNDFPTVAVRDIQIHPRERDLLVGTHGRGLWILDDIRPIEQMTTEVLESPLTLFDIRPATLYSSKSSSMYSGPHEYSAPNPPFGAGINYYLREKPKAGDVFRLSVMNSEGQEVSSLRATKNKGVNRFNDIKSNVTPLLEQAAEIQKTDIPKLNALLNEIKFPFIKISRY